MSVDKFSPKSSFIELCEYDREAKTLDLTFKSGTKVRYLYVFPATWESFKSAGDHGVYYSHLIKGRLRSVSLVSAKIGPATKKQKERSQHERRYDVTRHDVKQTRSSARTTGSIRKPGNIPGSL